MSEAIWENISNTYIDFINDGRDLTEHSSKRFKELIGLIEEYKDTDDSLRMITNRYLSEHPSPCSLIVYVLNRDYTSLSYDYEFTYENMLAYFSNKHIDDTSESFYDMILCMIMSNVCQDDFVYLCYKNGYGLKYDRYSKVEPFISRYSDNNATAEYIKYVYDNNIPVDLIKIFCFKTNRKEENKLDILKLIGDRTVNYTTLSHITENFTAPITDELKEKILKDLDDVNNYAKHGMFLVPTKKLADYIGLSDEEYEKYRKLYYDNLNIYIAQQLVFAYANDNYKWFDVDLVGDLVDLLNIKSFEDVRYLVKGMAVNRVKCDIDRLYEILKHKISDNVNWGDLFKV